MGVLRKLSTRMASMASIAMVLAVVTGAVAYAHGGGGGAVHACVSNVGGIVRIVEPNSGCPATASPLDWNVQGPRGPVGPAGPSEAFATRQPPGGSASIGSEGQVRVLSLVVPAGSYVINAKAMVAKTFPQQGMNYAGCQLSTGDASTTDLTPGDSAGIDSIPLHDTATFRGATTIALDCHLDGEGLLMIVNSRLTAMKVGSLR